MDITNMGTATIMSIATNMDITNMGITNTMVIITITML